MTAPAEADIPAASRPALDVGSRICGSAMHAAADRSIVVALRGARPVTPKRIRRGGNTGSFDLVARTELQLVASGRATLGNA